MAKVAAYLHSEFIDERPLGRGRTLIGRGMECDLRLPGPRVSRRHCVIESRDGRSFVVRDVSSLGTIVNGERILGERRSLVDRQEFFVDAFRVVIDLDGIAMDIARIPTGEFVFSYPDATEITQVPDEDGDDEAAGFGALLGSAPALVPALDLLRRAAQHHMPVLITGETGTGKELAARALHDHGPRRHGPFVPVNAALLTKEMFASTLFGHEVGAFTGAVRRTDGAFQRAHGGTLFLDEIGELEPEMQTKLLRVLESGEVPRLGADACEFPDVRVVAATNRDLAAQVEAGAFRSDLYHRLGVVHVALPPLRERLSDVPQIVDALLRTLGGPPVQVTPAAMDALRCHGWDQGNVRELRNTLTRAAMVCDAGVIDVSDLGLPEAEPSPETIRAVFLEKGRKVKTTARALDMAVTTLRRRLRRLCLLPEPSDG